MAEAKVFDIRGAECRIDGVLMNDVGPDGFTISPTAETTLIAGLTGEVGFNMDPQSGAEASITLKSTSPENAILRTLKQEQDARTKGPITFEITVKPEFQSAFGFRRKVLRYAMLVSYPEFETSEKEAPDYEWGFMGYGYSEE